MAAYRIREILSDSELESDCLCATPITDKEELRQDEGLSTTHSTSQAQSNVIQREAVGYEDELPVENFLIKHEKEGKVTDV